MSNMFEPPVRFCRGLRKANAASEFNFSHQAYRPETSRTSEKSVTVMQGRANYCWLFSQALLTIDYGLLKGARFMLLQRVREILDSVWLVGGCILLLGAIGCKPGSENATAVVDSGAEQAAEAPPAKEVYPAQRANANLCKLGAKLRDNNDAQKMITGIPGKLLDVKVGTVLDIQVPQAIQFFKAEHGRVPKNHAEFLSRVCEPNQIKLPDLIDGMVYQFNPAKEELWAYPEGESPVER